jgi:hypothetical protein
VRDYVPERKRGSKLFLDMKIRPELKCALTAYYNEGTKAKEYKGTTATVLHPL